MKPTKQEIKTNRALSLVAIIVSDNYNPDVKGDYELTHAHTLQDKRPMFQMSDDLIWRTIQDSLNDLRLSKVAHRLATELTTIALVQSGAVSNCYKGIKESSVYKASA